MRRELQPIIHKPGYTDQVEGQLRLYLWETIFQPLFERLAEAGIRVDKEDQEIGRTPQIQNGGGEWTLWPPELRSLRVKRRDMPQITEADRPAFEQYLASRSITAEPGTILPGDLRPTQEGYWPKKVEGALLRALEAPDSAPPIPVSQDWFILDGHHQWFAALHDHPGTRIQVVRYRAPIRALLAAARAFPRVQFKNAATPGDPVERALADGRLHYAGGKFSGQWSAAISRHLRKLGAVWDARALTFSLPLDRMDPSLRQAVALSQERTDTLHRELGTLLKQMEEQLPQAPAGLDYRKAVDNISGDLHKQFVRTVPALDSISVPPVVTPGMRAAITRDLTENLALYIKHFAAEEIPDLRRLVERNAFAGGRTQMLARIIEARWGVSKRKAKFLADQETSLLVSKYREETYKRIGVQRYVWSTAGDSRVRPTRPGETNNHRRLDGRIFDWDNPPVVDLATGRRCHPGEDFGCRCTAIPVLELPGTTVTP